MESKSKHRRPNPKIAVSKETTYVTGPLREDGYVDYVAAINQRCSEGVTPENNAAIPFWQAAGPKTLDLRIRARYFELLGMAELPQQGDYLLTFDEFVLLQDGSKRPNGDGPPAENQFDLAAKGPWSRERLPSVAAFLDRNSRPLQRLVDGLRRPKLYSPSVPCSPGGFADIALSPMASLVRDIARQLKVRAMLRLNDGDLVGTWQDVMAIYRLARLYAQGPFIVDQLIAVTLDGIAAFASIAVSMSEGVSPAMASACQADLRGLPAMPPFHSVLNQGERLYQLNVAQDVALSGVKPLSKPEEMDQWTWDIFESMDPDRNRREEAWNRLLDGDVDWTEVFRQYNAWHDQLVETLDHPLWTDRIKEAASLEEQAVLQVQQAIDLILSTKPSRIKDMSPQTKAQCATRLLAGPGLANGVNQTCVICEQRRQVYSDLSIVAFALAGYRYDHGKYPSRLAKLHPAYIDELPLDAFSGDDLHYECEGDGYLLYSVGPNLRDDGGHNFNRDHEDWSEYESATEEEKAADDIAIRTPAKRDGKK